MAEKYELDRWAAVVCNGFTAVNVMSSGNVEELGWDYTEMELDPTGTCGLFDGMLLDWDDDTPAERRDHEAYFPDAFTVGARIHNLSICNIGRQAEQVLIVDKCCACPIPAAADNHKLVYLGLRSAILNNGHKSAPSRLCFPVS